MFHIKSQVLCRYVVLRILYKLCSFESSVVGWLQLYSWFFQRLIRYFCLSIAKIEQEAGFEGIALNVFGWCITFTRLLCESSTQTQLILLVGLLLTWFHVQLSLPACRQFDMRLQKHFYYFVPLYQLFIYYLTFYSYASQLQPWYTDVLLNQVVVILNIFAFNLWLFIICVLSLCYNKVQNWAVLGGKDCFVTYTFYCHFQIILSESIVLTIFCVSLIKFGKSFCSIIDQDV